MTQSKLNRREAGFLARLGSFFRGERGWLEIAGYEAESLHADQPVRVLLGATVAGSIYAPKVVIAGLVRGDIITLELLVEAQGEVWGDVYTGLLVVEPQGQIHGWCSTIDAEGFLLLGSDDASPESLGLAESAATDDNGQGDVGGGENGRHAILRRIRAEAAAALVAQAELEQRFDEKLVESAGEKIAEAARLREELMVAQGDLLNRQRRQAALEETLKRRDSEIAELKETLATREAALAQQSEELTRLQDVHELQSKTKVELERNYKRLDIDYRAERVRADVLAGRVQNLESALQGSLQRSAEQQEALVRWQELAEVAESRVAELETELESTQSQLEEQSGIAEMLRARREKLELELENHVAELDDLRHQLLSTTPATEEAQAALALANRRIAELEQTVAERTQAAKEQAAALETAQLQNDSLSEQLEAAQQKIKQQNERLVQLRTDIDSHQTHAEKWKANVGRMTELLYDSEERARRLQAEVDEQKKAAQADHDRLTEQARQQALRIEAMESEITFYTREIELQRQRLTEIQAALVEREVELNRVRSAFDQQSLEIRKIRQLATNRIRHLEEELNQANRQNKDLSAWLEKRKK